MKSNKTPYIFIFDIDHTLIGKVSYIIEELDFIEYIQNVKKIKAEKSFIDFTNELEKGLIRPNTKEFMDFIKIQYAPCEIFVYTKSSFRWTNGPLVQNIEKNLNIKFNKPFFTREDTTINIQSNLEKSLHEIMPSIIKTLQKKYKKLPDIETLINERTVFIDDIDNNLCDMPNRQIVCPYYNYIPFYDIIERVQNKLNINLCLEDPKIKEYINNRQLIHKCDDTNPIEYHNKMLSQYIEKNANNEIALKDTFFKDLITILKKKKDLSDKVIKSINTKFTV